MVKRLKFAVVSAIFLLPLAHPHSALSRSLGYEEAVWMCGNGNLQACEVMYAHERARSGVSVATQRANVRNPAHWRLRAKEARTVADQMTHEVARTIMRRIAMDYDRLATLTIDANLGGDNQRAFNRGPWPRSMGPVPGNGTGEGLDWQENREMERGRVTYLTFVPDAYPLCEDASETRSGGMTMTALDDFAGTTSSPTDVRSVPSFWRRLISSIGSHRQRQANQYLAEYLRRHPEYQKDFGQLNRGVR